MKFTTSLKILFKSQLISTLVFIVLSAIGGDANIGEVLSFNLFVGLYFFAFSAAAYYTIGIIFHRIFLRFKLYNILYTFGLCYTVVLAWMTYLINFADSVSLDGALIVSLIILPQMLIIRYLTLKELRKAV